MIHCRVRPGQSLLGLELLQKMGSRGRHLLTKAEVNKSCWEKQAFFMNRREMKSKQLSKAYAHKWERSSQKAHQPLTFLELKCDNTAICIH